MRKTGLLVRVAAVLMADPVGMHYGLGLAEATGDLPRSIYPLPRRMLSAGWLTDGWETDAPEDGPPPGAGVVPLFHESANPSLR